jgi:hypothetical protein
MRALAKVFAATAVVLALAAPAVAQQACAPADLTRFTAEAMVSDADLRAEAEAALHACASFALDQLRAVGEIEERVLIQVAALAGRTSYATYAADEIPQVSPALIALIGAAFRPLYPHLHSLPEQENTAAMRTIVFHLLAQSGPLSTGSVARPAAPPATGIRP